MRLLPALLAATLLVPLPAAAQQEAFAGAPLPDPELARLTGKFVLPNGVELALAIVSDTVVNGQLLLRTVFTVDNGTQLQVYGRNGDSTSAPYPTATITTGGAVPGNIAIAIDRRSGLGTVTPSFSVSQNMPGASLGPAPQDATALGLSELPVTLGGPAVATADGTVSLQAVRNGTQVTLAGDQLAVANIVGQSIASAVVNSGNDRTIDTVTNVNIDLRNATAYQVGSAQLRVDTLALDAARGMVR